MDKYPLMLNGEAAGELTVGRETLYTRFDARCRLPEAGIWCAWAVGEQGELRLGVLEPAGEQAEICRRFSDRMIAPLGRLLRGEVRPASGRSGADWERVSEPGRLFRTPWLRRQLQGMRGAMARREGERQCLALPYSAERPFPLESLFCFARLRKLGEEWYVVYLFDRQEQPVFPDS